MQDFWIALGLIFAAEMGDKTPLVALSCAARFNARVVLAGVFWATLLVHGFSVALGDLVARLLPPGWTVLAAGLSFIGFGLWTLRGDRLDDEDCRLKRFTSPFWFVAFTFFLAELGDKTMLGTVTLATQYPLLPVWLGSTVGMVAADGLAIWVGQILGHRLPEKAVKLGAAAIFFVVGLIYLIQGVREIL